MVEQCEVSTYIEGVTFFPSDVWIAFIIKCTIREYPISTGHGVLIQIRIVVCITVSQQCIVTLLTKRSL